MNNPLQDSLVDFKKANTALHHALSTSPRNGIIVSAIVKNFEFTFELSWKAMEGLLSHHGIPTATPRQAAPEAYRKGFIDSEAVRLAMIEDRNLTVHTYDESFALEMAQRFESDYLPLFNLFLQRFVREASLP